MELATLLDFLKYLLTPVGIGVVLYFILEKLPYLNEAFDTLLPKTKRLVVLILCLVLPVIGAVGGWYFGYWPISEDTIYGALKAGIEAFTASQVAHMLVSMRNA